MWYVVWGYINKTDLTSELILSVWVWVLECAHTHTPARPRALAGLCRGSSVGWPFQPAPGCASSSSNSTPQPQSFSSPPPSQSPGTAPTPYSLQIASPSHLSQPIINYWWMGRLTGPRDREGRGKESKEQAWGWEKEVRRAQQTVITLTNWLHLFECALEGLETEEATGSHRAKCENC